MEKKMRTAILVAP